MDWTEVKLEDIAPPSVERQLEWSKFLANLHRQHIAAQQERDRIVVEWSNPSGLIDYAGAQHG